MSMIPETELKLGVKKLKLGSSCPIVAPKFGGCWGSEIPEYLSRVNPNSQINVFGMKFQKKGIPPPKKHTRRSHTEIFLLAAK